MVGNLPQQVPMPFSIATRCQLNLEYVTACAGSVAYLEGVAGCDFLSTHAPRCVLYGFALICPVSKAVQYRVKDIRTCGQSDPIPCLSILVPKTGALIHLVQNVFKPSGLGTCAPLRLPGR